MYISQAPKYLQQHPNYSNAGYGKLKRRGLSNQEIKVRWDHEQIFNEIAHQHLDIDTLDKRGASSYDFHDLPIWMIKDALEAAYKAGQQSVSH